MQPDTRLSFGDFMRATLDLFPDAQVGEEGGQLVIHTGLRQTHDEGGNAYVEPMAE